MIFALVACFSWSSQPEPATPGAEETDTAPPVDTEAPEPDDSGGGSGIDTGPFDIDGDGYVAAEDCDDADPSIFPGADDPTCDGVDQDCSGDDDRDRDGDGSFDPECGGDDCEPDDPWIGVGLQEWCDEVDHDCDGEPLAAGVCAEAQEILAVSSLTVVGDTQTEGVFATDVGYVGDLDGDGADEVFASCPVCQREDGTVGYTYYLFSGTAEGRDVLHTELDYLSFTDAGYEQVLGQYPTPIGDFDGDGLNGASSGLATRQTSSAAFAVDPVDLFADRIILATPGSGPVEGTLTW